MVTLADRQRIAAARAKAYWAFRKRSGRAPTRSERMRLTAMRNPLLMTVSGLANPGRRAGKPGFLRRHKGNIVGGIVKAASSLAVAPLLRYGAKAAGLALNPRKKVYRKIYAAFPSERGKRCPHTHMRYTGRIPNTGVRRCMMCGATEDQIRKTRNNTHLEGKACIQCSGPLMMLGALGRREHYRCRNCGMEFSAERPQRRRPVKRDPSPKANPSPHFPSHRGELYEIFFRAAGDQWHNGPFKSIADAKKYVALYKSGWKGRAALRYRIVPYSEWYGSGGGVERSRLWNPLRGRAVTLQASSRDWERIKDLVGPELVIGNIRVHRPPGKKHVILVATEDDWQTVEDYVGADPVIGRVSRVRANPCRLNPRPKRRLSVPEMHQRRIAKQTARMPAAMAGVMGGGPRVRKVRLNPGSRKRMMSLAAFVAKVRATGDRKLLSDLNRKINAYKRWTHGSPPKRVLVEKVNTPGVSGMMIGVHMGKQPEALYSMPKNSKRKGAWRHPWETMPDLIGDPKAGIIMTRLRGKSRITDFLHR